MNFLEMLKMSFRNLTRRKLRTFLTILSVTIGTSAIVIMLSLGFAIQKQDKEWIDSNASLNQITILPNNRNIHNSGEEGLNDLDLKKISKIKNIDSIMPIIQAGFANILVKNKEYYAAIEGVDTSKLKDFGYEIEEGRMLTSADKDGFIFGNIDFIDYSKKEDNPSPEDIDLFKEKPEFRVGYKSDGVFPMEDTKTYEDFSVVAIGKLKDSNNTKDKIFINLDFARKLTMVEKKLFGDNEKVGKKITRESDVPYSEILVRVDKIEDIAGVEDEIKDLGFETFSMRDINKGLEERNRILNAVLGGIGGVSLLVATIGIANTMIMSIYERTREIGIIKVIGASVRDIRNMFLIEASLIGLLGGIFGIGFSYFLSFLLNSFAQNNNDMFFAEGKEIIISYIPIWLSISAAIFSSLMGLISGYVPAIRATRISAIDAIRTN